MIAASDKFASPGAFRLVLALAVFLHHTTNVNLGMTAVLVFFTLSGYWVAVMWRDGYSRTELPYFTYLVSRAWRLLPVFALCSVLAWALLIVRGGPFEPIGSVARQLFSNLFIFGYASLPYQVNVPGWSLDMEMQFYLVAPLLILLISRNLLVVGGCAVISAVAQARGGAGTVAPFLFFFAVGIASAIHDVKPGKSLAYGALAFVGVVILLCVAALVKDFMLDEPHRAPLLAFGHGTNMLLALALTPFALWTVRQKTGARDRMLGDLSYIVYLLHWPILGAMHTGDGGYLDRIVLCTEALALTFVAAWAIWALFDHPINRMRSAWVAGRKARAAEGMALAA